jgi:hypothetical protein
MRFTFPDLSLSAAEDTAFGINAPRGPAPCGCGQDYCVSTAAMNNGEVDEDQTRNYRCMACTAGSFGACSFCSELTCSNVEGNRRSCSIGPCAKRACHRDDCNNDFNDSCWWCHDCNKDFCTSHTFSEGGATLCVTCDETFCGSCRDLKVCSFCQHGNAVCDLCWEDAETCADCGAFACGRLMISF